MNLNETKIVVAVLFGLVRVGFGLLPIPISAWLKPKAPQNHQYHPIVHMGLVLFRCFSGGVLFATCFLYMMPLVCVSVEELKEKGVLNTTYPTSQLLVSLGFFIIYFLEECCHWLVNVAPKTCCKLRRSPNEIPMVIVENQESEKISVTIPSKADKETQIDEDLVAIEFKSNEELLHWLLVALALSVHSIFEGIAVGLQDSTTDIWYVFIATSIHSATQLFHIGLLVQRRAKTIAGVILRVLVLAITTPAGVLVGVILNLTVDSSSEGLWITDVVLEGASTGTILYITFIEILGKEKERRVNSGIREFVMAVGFAMMAGLVCMTYF